MENTIAEEQIENIKKAIIEVAKFVIQIYERIKDCFVKLWLQLKAFVEKNKIDKFYKIYKRTKNRRIQKKQITKIIKLLQNYKK